MTDHQLKDKTVCFTGTLTTQTRAQASKVAKGFGAKVTSAVSGNTDILIVGPTGAGSKLAQAKAKGVEVWTEEQFNAVVNGDNNSGGITDNNNNNDVKNKSKTNSRKKKAVDEPEKVVSTPAKKRAKKAATSAAAPSPVISTPKKNVTMSEAAAADFTTPDKKKTPTKTTSSSSTKKLAPATPSKDGSSRRKVMTSVPNGHMYEVYGDHDVKLMLSDSLNANSNKYYKLQLLQGIGNGNFYVATNWGRLGESGQSQLKGPFADEDKGIKEFAKVFRSKTKNAWGVDPFVRFDGKYQLVETTIDDADDDSGGGGDAALGRLTESQIHKGQEVLKQLRQILECGTKKQKNDKNLLGRLSNDFYSLIPTTSGRQRPPPVNNLDIVTEKEGLLEFWLRMGFEELGDGDIDGSPIEGVFDLPVPKTLNVAASNITDQGSIKSSKQRGTELAKAKTIKMGPELYAAILLYTGNSIYRELNRCLRSDWKKVKKYWNYLRLYFEAMDAMEGKCVTLYRGIAVDLFDEYEPGKIITWWSISSCTASKAVAQNFMNQLGGAAATFLTLHTKKACDVSALSFYPHEKESLLRPGTKLKVLNRKRNGKVVEIEVEEVV